MDMQLPGMSGIEATRQLKTDPDTAGIHIVALTAHAYPDELDAALQAGCSGCITKPIDIRTFPEQVRQFLPV
jgi:CheY-like chemotaxis protein